MKAAVSADVVMQYSAGNVEGRQPCCRRFFATAINKTDLAALLRSPAVPVQLAALRASNALSQHVETLTSSTVPVIVRQLQSTDGAPLFVHASIQVPALFAHASAQTAHMC